MEIFGPAYLPPESRLTLCSVFRQTALDGPAEIVLTYSFAYEIERQKKTRASLRVIERSF
jgi:hypothetical protein